MLRPFVIHQPKTVVEAAALLREYGDDAAFYAGGTELLIVLKEHLSDIGHLIDLKRIPGLSDITVNAASGTLTIGALATHRAVERSPLVRQHLPALAALEAQVANVRVRAAGTIGGNLCFADPHSDPATLLAALGAGLTLDNGAELRVVPAASFTTDLMTTLRQPDELLTAITIPLPATNTGVGYERIKLHERPTAAVAAVVSVVDSEIVGAQIVVGCIGNTPQRLQVVEAALLGLPALAASAERTRRVFTETAESYDTAFESAAYKRQLAAAVGVKALAAAIADATRPEEARHVA
ncbi:MAG: FAD binding domain-containing protein [Thermomicrobiales bacterium]